MSEPAVSIIMPAFNAGKTIADSINSVLEQTYDNWELLIVNDGSTDNTSDILSSIDKTERRIRIIDLTKNGGLPNARNTAAKMARGEFIAFLDSDDLWHPDKLNKQLQFHRENHEIEISHTDFDSFDDKGPVKRPFKNLIDTKKNKQGNLYPGICYKNPIGILTVMVKTKLVEEAGYFDTTLWTMEDQDLWMRIAKRNKAFGYIPEVLANYRITPGSISRKTGKYKRAYKLFIQKLLRSENLNTNLLYRNYYRHFGTVYFRKRQHRLCALYFWKSIRLYPYDFIAVSTLIYLLYDMAYNILQKIRSALPGVNGFHKILN